MSKESNNNRIKNLIELTDFSNLDDKNVDLKNVAVKNSVLFNLGLKKEDDDNKEKYLTDKYCGWCWLKNYDGGYVYDENNKPYIMHVKCRFKGFSPNEKDAVTEMFSTIALDEEFIDYLSLDLPEGERLITYFFDEKPIEAENTDDDNRLLTVISFIKVLERLTRRNIMRKSVRKTENLTGRIRGKIQFNKHLSKNICHGREEKIYCRYSERTEDIPENQILKFALKKAEIYLKEKYDKVYDSMLRDIRICRHRLENVSDAVFRATDIKGIILPGMYSNYKSALQFAGVIISEISMISIGDSERIGIIPYAVNMPLLFECYARKRIKDKLKEIAPKDKCEARMLKFISDKRSMDKLGDEFGYLSVMEDKKSECYIKGSVVPDIVIEYTCKEENKEEKFYRIYDVKYKWSENKKSARDDRLQLLAYEFMYNCDNNLGFIFPKQELGTKAPETSIITNPPLEEDEKNGCKRVFADKDDETLYYIEFYLGNGKIDNDDWLIGKV